MSTAPQEPSGTRSQPPTSGGEQPAGMVPPPPTRTTAVQLGSDRRNWGVAAHLSAFVAAWAALAFLGPLLVWLVKKDDDEFVGHHAREALNFQLTWLLAGFVAGVVTFVLAVVTLGVGLVVVGLVALVVGLPLLVTWVWCTINGAVHASRGEAYHYPLSVRMVC